MLDFVSMAIYANIAVYVPLGLYLLVLTTMAAASGKENLSIILVIVYGPAAAIDCFILLLLLRYARKGLATGSRNIVIYSAIRLFNPFLIGSLLVVLSGSVSASTGANWSNIIELIWFGVPTIVLLALCLLMALFTHSVKNHTPLPPVALTNPDVPVNSSQE